MSAARGAPVRPADLPPSACENHCQAESGSGRGATVASVIGVVVKGIVRVLGPALAEVALLIIVSVGLRYGRRLWRWFWD